MITSYKSSSLQVTPSQTSTSRVTQRNEIFNRNDMLACAYFGNSISFFKYLSLLFVHFPQQFFPVFLPSIPCSTSHLQSCFPQVRTCFCYALKLFSCCFALQCRKPSTAVKEDKANEGSCVGGDTSVASERSER